MAGSFAPSFLTTGPRGKAHTRSGILPGSLAEKRREQGLNCMWWVGGVKERGTFFPPCRIASHLKKEKSQQTNPSQTPLITITPLCERRVLLLRLLLLFLLGFLQSFKSKISLPPLASPSFSNETLNHLVWLFRRLPMTSFC